MRIAVNARLFINDKMEGVGWYSFEVVKRMVEMHPEDTFIFLFDNHYDTRFILAKNVVPVVVRPPARHPLLWYLWFEWLLPVAFKKYKADVFFSPDGHCSIRSRIPTLMTVHDVAYIHYPEQVGFLVRKFYQYFVPRYQKRAQIISTVSMFVKDDIVNNLGIDEKKIIVARNGCRDEFKPISPERQEYVKSVYTKGKSYFLYYGAIHPRKNVLKTIEAYEKFKSISDSDICLVLIGRMSWHTNEVELKLKNSVYRNDIIHLGYVGEQLSELVASARAVVYVSYFEGFGLPVLEAMASGVPVITSNVSSLPEVAGDAAILVNPNDINEIVDAMSQIYYNNSIADTMISKGLLRAKEFSWDRTAKVIYESLCLLRQ